MLEVTLEKAQQSDKEFFRNLFNMYQNELAEYFDEFQRVDSNGYYEYDTVDVYFDGNEAVMPFIVKQGNNRVGILVISKAPFVKAGCDYCIQEFFLLGYYRGRGIAKECCKMVFSEYAGRYCFLVLEKNKRALKFWRKLCKEYDPSYSEQKKENELIFECLVENSRLCQDFQGRTDESHIS